MKTDVTKSKQKTNKPNKKDKRPADKSAKYLKYKRYIKSKDWREMKERIFADIYQKKCYFCGDTKKIGLHHNSYEYLQNEYEHPETVIPICPVCHIALHRIKKNLGKFRIS